MTIRYLSDTGYADLAQLVEHLSCKQGVGSSNLLVGIICGSSSVVEHHLAMVGVAGSNPVFRLIPRGIRLYTICTHSATG